MPPVSVDDVKISSNGNSVTIGDSVKIVVSGSSPTRVKVSRDNMSSEQVIKLNDLNTKNSNSTPIPKKSEGNHLNGKYGIIEIMMVMANYVVKPTTDSTLNVVLLHQTRRREPRRRSKLRARRMLRG